MSCIQKYKVNHEMKYMETVKVKYVKPWPRWFTFSYFKKVESVPIDKIEWEEAFPWP